MATRYLIDISDIFNFIFDDKMFSLIYHSFSIYIYNHLFIGMHGRDYSGIDYASQYPSQRKSFHNWGVGAVSRAIYPINSSKINRNYFIIT